MKTRLLIPRNNVFIKHFHMSDSTHCYSVSDSACQNNVHRSTQEIYFYSLSHQYCSTSTVVMLQRQTVIWINYKTPMPPSTSCMQPDGTVKSKCSTRDWCYTNPAQFSLSSMQLLHQQCCLSRQKQFLSPYRYQYRLKLINTCIHIENLRVFHFNNRSKLYAQRFPTHTAHQTLACSDDNQLLAKRWRHVLRCAIYA